MLLGYTVLVLPNRLMLSEYVHVPGGLVPFVGGLLALAVAAAAAARLGSPLGGPGALGLRVGIESPNSHSLVERSGVIVSAI